MSKTGIANLPLHHGKAPRWLFKRMVLLSTSIIEIILYEYGKDILLRRLSDPYWFQALSCVLGFDWHSSGTTTVTCGALKEAIEPEEFGIVLVGGKGKASNNTLHQVEKFGDLYNLSTSSIEELKYSSRMAAKIDNTAVQDGYSLYHHVLLFSENNKWAVIQQGINTQTNYARRYHWLSEQVETFVCEPHNAIIGDIHQEKVLDMTSKESGLAQKMSVDLINDGISHLKKDWAEVTLHENQRTLDNWNMPKKNNVSIQYLHMPKSINWNKMEEIYNFQPSNYEQLLSIKGVGSSTVRALALISDLIYGKKPSWSDPIKYSFTVGGKDGVPFPVDRKAMDESTNLLKEGIEKAKIGDKDKFNALKRLHTFIPENKNL
jgi:hypothetical protein